ncbi:MFS transporter [Butyricimonas virosa]|uniref:MFS transporter n=1 Tax=Butyricimonas virosa TaxID=544645 RepID=A0A412WT30_9BACT|nr:MFS transporter [Butyricimonas virosa]MCI7388989.1 MFS transporter [Butyricimonas virosa]MDY4904501.1 MFS transporter [Butyricimonas virosa]RGV30490.1 MFS transporter [Butyricimonas virosa]
MSTKEVEWDGLPIPKRYWAILAIAMGITVSVLDGTIANVALPSIAEDLQATPAMSIWIVNAYQLAIVVSLLSLSSLGDILGYRRVYIGGLLIFSVTSLACALSNSLLTLTVARVFQGFGAAALASVNTSLIRIIYPKRHLGRGMGINALVVAVSAAGGPTIAAGILSVASWQWLFAINVPIVIAALILSFRFLPVNPVKRSGRKFDWISGLMNAFTFGLLIFSIEGFTHGMSLSILLPGIGVVLLVGYFFVRRQLSQEYPLLPVDLLKIPIFSLSVGTSVCSFVAQMLAMVSLPFFLQHTLGQDEVATGLLLTPWPLATMIAAPLAGRLIERVHAGVLGGVGLSIFSAGLFLLAVFANQVSNAGIALFMAMCGFGFGLFQTPNNSILISSAPQNRSGGASGMLGMARLTGQTTGASLVALMFVVFPVDGTYASLYFAGGFATLAAIVSFTRVSLPEPEMLMTTKKKKVV